MYKGYLTVTIYMPATDIVIAKAGEHLTVGLYCFLVSRAHIDHDYIMSVTNFIEEE